METLTLGATTYSCPFAGLLPPLSPDERAALAEDIRQRGVLVAVVVDEENNVLDGHHRLEIAAELGLPDIPVKVVAGLTAGQKRALAEDLNLHRRHLGRDEIRRLLARRLQADPNRSDRAIAAEARVDHKTVGRVRGELERRGEIPHVAARSDTKGRKQPATRKNVRPGPGGSVSALPAAPLPAAPEGVPQQLPAEPDATPRPGPAPRLKRWPELKSFAWDLQRAGGDMARLAKVRVSERDPRAVRDLARKVRELVDRLEREVLGREGEV
jgi:hypothetical protein